jgi:hypothetical protein
MRGGLWKMLTGVGGNAGLMCQRLTKLSQGITAGDKIELLFV